MLTGHFDETTGYGIDRPAGRPDWLLIHTLAGAGDITHREGAFRVGPHDAILIAPDTPHGYRTAPNPGRWELLWTHFNPAPAWNELLHWPREGPGAMRLSLGSVGTRGEILGRLAEVHRHASGYTRHAERLALNALETTLLLCDEINPEARHARLDDRIRTALDHISHHLTDDLSVPALAGLANLSPSRFAHLFRGQMHDSPQRFVEAARLDRAAQLLEHTNLSVASIAQRVGFESPFYFSRRFKQHRGQSPRAFRRGANAA